MPTPRARFIDAVTLLTGIASIAVAGKMLLTRPTSPQPKTEIREISNWSKLVEAGRRIGPEGATLEVLEWGDYECPACRGFHLQLSALQRKYPRDVAIAFRHFPLDYHKAAYFAARAAECAASQGNFAAMHAMLLEGTQLDYETFVGYAKNANLPDLDAFRLCLDDRNPVERIETDLAVARAISARGTPTVVVNGTLYAPPPDSSALEQLLLDILASANEQGGS